jgi:multidrug resistance efflux pump
MFAETAGQVVVDARLVPTSVVNMSFPFDALVAEVLVEAGDTVKKGQPLMRMNTRPLELEIEEMETFVKQYSRGAGFDRTVREASQAEAEALLERAQINLERAKLALEQATILAPFDGVVSQVSFQPGEYAEAREPAIIIADTAKWKLIAENVSEFRVLRLNPNDKARVTFFALPGKEFTATVSRVDSVGRVAGADTIFSVELTLENLDPQLRWNMNASVAIEPGK